jgi:hypothetical protein
MPADTPTRSPQLAEVLEAATAAMAAGLHVSLPGRIVKWDAQKQRADVKPCIKRAFYGEDDARGVESLPVVASVPVIFPGSGGYRMTFPIHAGDTDGDACLLVFSDGSLDRWLSGTGGEVDPEVDHGHILADAVAFVGLRPFGAPLSSCPTDEATLGKDDGVQVHLEAGTITIGDKAGADFVALAQKVLTELQNLQTHFAALEAVITGASIPEPGNGAPSALQIALKAAVALSPYPSPGSVAASQAKAK